MWKHLKQAFKHWRVERFEKKIAKRTQRRQKEKAKSLKTVAKYEQLRSQL